MMMGQRGIGSPFVAVMHEQRGKHCKEGQPLFEAMAQATINHFLEQAVPYYRMWVKATGVKHSMTCFAQLKSKKKERKQETMLKSKKSLRCKKRYGTQRE